MVSGRTPPRSSAAFAATAPRSMAETDASAPPGSPSPRLPPIHSAMGVRAPEMMTMSGRLLLDKEMLLAFEDRVEDRFESSGGIAAAGRPRTWRPYGCTETRNVSRPGRGSVPTVIGTHVNRLSLRAPCRVLVSAAHEGQHRVPDHAPPDAARVREHHARGAAGGGS